MFSLARNASAEKLFTPALTDTAATAGGAGDNADANGITIDTLAFERAESIAFIAAGTAVLGASQTLALPVRVQDSADGTTWADVVDPRTGSVISATVTSAAGAGTRNVVTVVDASLEYCRRYVRCVAKPDLSAGTTDTARIQAVAMFSGVRKV